MRFFLNCWRISCIFVNFSLSEVIFYDYEVLLNMSDGDGKDGVEFLKQNHQAKKKNKTSGVDDFAEATARIAVAQVCESVGYQSFQQSALNTFTDVGVRYIREIGKIAMFYANLANRSECNVFDVIQGLEDFGAVQGFSGACDVNHCLSGSGVVKGMIQYVDKAVEFPFAHSIPSFPVVKDRKPYPSFAQTGENLLHEHIPSWLPKFPDPETCVDLDSRDKKEVEFAIEGKIEDWHMKVNKSFLNLQRKFLCNGSEAGLAVEHGDAARAQQAVKINPFFAPPLQFEEKEVSLPILPAKLVDEHTGKRVNHAVAEKHDSVLEPCVPAAEAIRSEPFESEEDRRKVLLNGRTTVKFKFVSSRKCLGTAISSWNEGDEKIALWFGVDHDEKDDKERRAEQICRENMNSQDIARVN